MSDTSSNSAEQPQQAGYPSQGGSSEIVPAAAGFAAVEVQSSVAIMSVSSQTRGLYTAAAIINWVVLGLVIAGTLGFGIIVAAWFIPMTIQMHKGAKGPYKHTALGVCTLLFCNLISGILILVDDSNRPRKPIA